MRSLCCAALSRSACRRVRSPSSAAICVSRPDARGVCGVALATQPLELGAAFLERGAQLRDLGVRSAGARLRVGQLRLRARELRLRRDERALALRDLAREAVEIALALLQRRLRALDLGPHLRRLGELGADALQLGLELGHARALRAGVVDLDARLGERRARLGELRLELLGAPGCARHRLGALLGGRELRAQSRNLCARFLELGAGGPERLARGPQLARLLLEPVGGVLRLGERLGTGGCLLVARDELSLERGHALLGRARQLRTAAQRGQLGLERLDPRACLAGLLARGLQIAP